MTFNEWLLSLSEGRRNVLIDDKWMLAQAAYEAGKPDPENPKRGDIYRMADDNHPIVVEYMDAICVWAWYGGRKRGFPFNEWRYNIQTKGIVPF